MNLPKQMEAVDHLYDGNRYAAENNFQDAAREYETVVSLTPQSKPADKALFRLGLLYARADNPLMDYEKSLSYFERLMSDFPGSDYAVTGKSWISVLTMLLTHKQKYLKVKERLKICLKKPPTPPPAPRPKNNGKPPRKATPEYLYLNKKLIDAKDFTAALLANKKVLSLHPDTPPGDNALYNMGLIYAHYDNPNKDYKKSLAYFKELLKKFPTSKLYEQAKIWIDLLDTMEKAKQVDIEIEEKRKELIK